MGHSGIFGTEYPFWYSHCKCTASDLLLEFNVDTIKHGVVVVPNAGNLTSLFVRGKTFNNAVQLQSSI